jgi:hypothetical protein
MIQEQRRRVSIRTFTNFDTPPERLDANPPWLEQPDSLGKADMIGSPQGLGEDVGEVEVRENRVQGNAVQLEEVAKVEVTKGDVLGPGVIHASVLAQLDGAFVVAVKRRQDGVAEISQESGQPDSLLGSHGACIELCFTGGEGDR